MQISSHKQKFTTNYLSSEHWYERLATILTIGDRAAAFLALTDELVEQLMVDSMLLLHFPATSGPKLLYNNSEHSRRYNSVEDYLSGNYAIDPFYLNRTQCRDSGLVPLKEVIEEEFSSSEYYKAHYKGAGLVDEICLFCTDSQSGQVVLSLSRAIQKDHYDQEEITALQHIAPLVRNMMRLSWHSLSDRHVQRENSLIEAENLHLHIENARTNFGKSVLTAREFDVLQLLLRGNSIDLIAKKLRMSAGTAKVHRKHIYAKLHIRSQSEVFSLFLDVVSATQYIPNQDPLDQYQIEEDESF